jgi:hypothetical protein
MRRFTFKRAVALSLLVTMAGGLVVIITISLLFGAE